jgi:hypothetical protein
MAVTHQAFIDQDPVLMRPPGPVVHLGIDEHRRATRWRAGAAAVRAGGR